MKKLIHTILLTLCLIIAASAEMPANGAGKLSLKARLDSTQLLMGKATLLHLDLVTDKGRQGEFPVFLSMRETGIVGVCGDSVELHSPASIDTVDLGSGRLQIKYAVPVQAFDSGLYKIPPIEYISGTDTVYSNRLVLKVVPLMGVKAEDEISPMQGVVPPENVTWTDKIPDIIYYGWWWMLLAIVAIVASIILIKKYGNKQSLIKLVKKPQPVLEPWDEALQSLDRLQAEKIFEKGEEKEYYSRLTDILRVYLERRFSIRAMEMTTEQILDILQQSGETKSHSEYVRSILDVADFVKFAKMRPLPDEAKESMEYARRFVEETTPAPEEKTEDNGDNDETHEID